MSAAIFKKKNAVGENAISTVRFKTKSFEKFIYWEIAAKKLDFAASEQQRHRSDCDDVKTSVIVC